VVDDSAAVRDAICHYITRDTPFKNCYEADQGVSAIETAREHPPALVVMNLNLPMLDGVETASALRVMHPSAKIIGLGMFDGEFRKTQIAAAGFDMIISKRQGLAKLGEAINELLPPPPTTDQAK
jgi:DNA-binding NarL/FixJ family response regulator